LLSVTNVKHGLNSGKIKLIFSMKKEDDEKKDFKRIRKKVEIKNQDDFSRYF
jgi:hypothetical protein